MLHVLAIEFPRARMSRILVLETDENRANSRRLL